MSNFRIVSYARTLMSKRGSLESIYDEKELLDKLKDNMIQEYAQFIVLSPENDELQIGIAECYAFAQFTVKSREPPYLCATRKNGGTINSEPLPFITLPNHEKEEYIPIPLFDLGNMKDEKKENALQLQCKERLINFRIDGRLTPVPLSLCVSLKDALDIIVHYFRYQELSKEFEWKSV